LCLSRGGGWGESPKNLTLKLVFCLKSALAQPNLTMMHNKDYFEGILQLRNIDKKVVEFAVKEIEKNENAHIAKIKKMTNGVDIYLSPQKLLRGLGNKLQHHFGGQLVVSTKLHTRSRVTSKGIYRVSMLFRIPKFKKGDIIDYKGDKINILAIQKKVFAKDIKTGKKLNIRFKDLFR
jgi:nonsense-mediated mRNA decay protein 3